MRKFLFIISLVISQLTFAQKIEKRLIVFGDAGEINPKQTFLIERSHNLIQEGRTVAFFVGDNIYPVGMNLSVPENEETGNILRSQYEGFRARKVPVYFLAGNHDWDKSKRDGLAKIKAQGEFIKAQQDQDLRFIPEAGTLGPSVISLTKQISVIAYDSEYWLFPHHGSSIENEKKQFIQELAHLLEENQKKWVIIMSHHPMVTFGEHGLKYTWKDHIFPLTHFWKPAYLPLPGIGSLYPFFRSTVFATPEDIKHPEYKDLITRVMETCKNHPNLIFISGHDHGLQYIAKDQVHQVVSGSGSKTSEIKPDDALKYRYNKQGFSVIDCLENGDLRIQFYIDQPTGMLNEAFETIIPFQLPH